MVEVIMKKMRVLFTTALLSLLSGCSIAPSAESDFYMLSSSPLPHRQIDLNSELIIVGPLTMADYLKRSSLVTPISDYKYEVSKLDQWAGNLESEFQTALVKNLSALDAERVYVRYPSFLSTQSHYNLRIDVLRFDAGLNGQVRLEASWAWVDSNRKAHAGGHFSKTEQVGSGPGLDKHSIEATVAAQSALLQQLSEEVLKAL
jgi:uncharacterized lipoprotein YmbA